MLTRQPDGECTGGGLGKDEQTVYMYVYTDISPVSALNRFPSLNFKPHCEVV